MCAHVSMCVHICVYLRKLEEGMRFPGAGDTGDCEIPSIDHSN